jgi:hypothetical protein
MEKKERFMQNFNVDLTKQLRSRRQTPARLSGPLNQRLAAYALAAGAAGVAVLACSGSAEAAPVCKSLSTEIPSTNTYPLNPAGQAAPPFDIVNTTLQYVTSAYDRFFWWNRGFFIPNTGGANVVLGAKDLPANLEAGNMIGPGGNFGKGKSYGLMFTYGKGFPYDPQGHGTMAKHRGNFDLKQTNYIGFVFTESGAAHYGWARIEVTFKQGGIGKYSTIHLLGWGYESAPNTAIAAGSCSGEQANAGTPNPSSASTGASLGVLALGSEGIPAWR